MVKPQINGPSKGYDDSSSPHECRLALEPSLTGLAEAAAKVGWHPRIVAQSLMVLSALMLDEHSKGDRTLGGFH